MRIPIISDALERRTAAQVEKVLSLVPKQKLSSKGEKYFDVLGGLFEFPHSGLSDEKSVSKKILKANKEWVYRNNDVIAMEVSKMEFELYSVGLKDGEIVYNEVETHPLLDLLDRPNQETTTSDALYIIQSHKKLTGDAFWLKIRKGQQVVGLRQLQPDKITLKLRQPTETDPTVIESFEYKDVIDGIDIDIFYDPRDIIHLKKPNPSNHFRGYGSVEALSETIDTDNLTNLTTKNFFKKGAITNFVLTTEKTIQPDQLKRLKTELKQMYGGASNAYELMILGGGLKPEKLSFSNKEMEFLAQLTWYRDKIMVGFGNTLASLGMLDDVNRATHESSMIEWKRNTIKPDMDSILDALNEFLVPEFGQNLILAYVDPIPEDRDSLITESTSLFSGGIIMRNEARELLSYESVEGGDVFNQPNTATEESAVIVEGETDEVVDQEVDDAKDGEDKHVSPRQVKKLSKKRKPSETPASLVHVNVKAILRRRGVFLKLKHNQEIKELMKPIAKAMLKGKKSKAKVTKDPGEYTPPVHATLSAEQIMAYYQKQLHSVDVVEEHLQVALNKFLKDVKEKALAVLETDVNAAKSKRGKQKALAAFVTKDILDGSEDDFVERAQLDFTPLLDNLAAIAGQEAYNLVDPGQPYILSNQMKQRIVDNVNKFTKSMLDTDRQYLTDIITSGISNGDSILDIRNNIDDAFPEYSKNQAMRIGRTEVSRASSQSALDAWTQSGVVEGKQWITAGATDECADYEGKVESLDSNFYGGTDDFADGDPPLHPNCRCALIPIVMGANDN